MKLKCNQKRTKIEKKEKKWENLTISVFRESGNMIKLHEKLHEVSNGYICKFP
jgi:hypothetical protein